jgi:hypothetical protein
MVDKLLEEYCRLDALDTTNWDKADRRFYDGIKTGLMFARDILAGSEHMTDKGYTVGTTEHAEQYAKKRNYHYTNTDNPIDFPKDTE